MGMTRSTISKPKRTNHILHLLLSIVTAGLWLPIWIIVAIVNAFRNKEETITTHKVD